MTRSDVLHVLWLVICWTFRICWAIFKWSLVCVLAILMGGLKGATRIRTSTRSTD